MTTPKPWFRQFWPWVLIGIPGLTVVACMFTIYLAIVSADGMVQDNYYKEGLAINQTIAKDERATALGLSAYVRIGADQQVEMFLTSNEAITGPVQLHMIHPTRANHDAKILLAQSAQGSYQGTLPLLAPGNWHVELSDEAGEWRIRGRMDYPANRDVRMAP